jgi:hypothetical protein
VAAKEYPMRKALPDTMLNGKDQPRLGALCNWVLDHKVTEIEMTERQFWNFVQLQPVAEKPWTTFMGRQLRVPGMPETAQKTLGIFEQGIAAAA